jgi:hypothetical protein
VAKLATRFFFKVGKKEAGLARTFDANSMCYLSRPIGYFLTCYLLKISAKAD